MATHAPGAERLKRLISESGCQVDMLSLTATSSASSSACSASGSTPSASGR